MTSRRPVRLTVCRDCCCGTERKHPDVDHDGQLDRLRQIAAATGGTVRVSECLDVCGNSNVVVVHEAGGKPIWLGFVLGEAVLDDLERWLGAGGPGAAPIPASLDLNRITPPSGKQPV